MVSFWKCRYWNVCTHYKTLEDCMQTGDSRMNDFKQSWDQRMWESALNSHTRAIKTIEICKRIIANNSLTSHIHLEYWEKRKAELEEKYPQLKKGM